MELSSHDFDGVIIPGGYAPDYMRRHPFLLRFVGDMHHQGKLVAAICHAAWVPISAGILKGRHVTCYRSIKDDVINAGGLYEDAELVEDGNLLTSRQPEDLGAFCRAIIRKLSNDE